MSHSPCRTVPSAFVLVALAAFAAAAADFWTAKPFDGWSEKETQKLLGDSPWARSVSVTLTPSDARAMVGGGEPGEGDDGPVREGAAKATLRIVWTGKTVRKAQVRKNVLGGVAVDPAQSAAFIEGDSPELYVVALIGPGFPPLTSASEDELLAATQLRIGKKGAARVLSPSKVVRPDGTQGAVAIFLFPHGDAPITAADGTVTFATKLGKYDVGKAFDIGDMVVDGAPDL